VSLSVHLRVTAREAGGTVPPYGCSSQWYFNTRCEIQGEQFRIAIHYAEMDPIRESQEIFDNLVDNEVDYSDDANWVEAAWRREDTSDFYQNSAGEQEDDDGAESFEMHRGENLSGPAEGALETSPDERGIHVARMTTERILSCSNTQPHEAQKSRQGISSNDGGSIVRRGNSRYTIILTLSPKRTNNSQIIHLPRTLQVRSWLRYATVQMPQRPSSPY
jgi:hypothetical protein